MKHADIIHAEKVTAARSRQEIGNWLEKFEYLINLLLKLNYFFKINLPVEDDNPDDWFFAFAYEKYLEAPYSLHVCNSLMEQGHYLNAMIQLRSLLDYFVSCRYLHKHPQHVIPYRSGQKCLIEGKKGWLRTSQIYKYFSESFYDSYYGDMLSCLSHGKVGLEIYRIDRSNSKEARVILVPEFNLRHSFSIINHLVPMIYGYLSHYLEFFDVRLKEIPLELNKERIMMADWLKDQHMKRSEKHPESNVWTEGMNCIIGISILQTNLMKASKAHPVTGLFYEIGGNPKDQSLACKD